MWNMQKNSEKNIGSKREYSSKKKERKSIKYVGGYIARE